MTQKEKIREAILYAMRVKSIASSIKNEGDDYDMQWHKAYVSMLNDASDSLLKKLR